MNTFKGGGGGFKSGGSKFGGGGRPRDGKRFGGGSSSRSSGSGEMFKASCADCGKSCEVPFKPNGEKPVYCSDCFGRHKSENNRDGDRRHDEGRPRPQFESRPARPTMAREHTDTGLTDIKRQLANLEQKLNRILDIINPPQPAAKASVRDESVAHSTPLRTEKKMRVKAESKRVPSEADIKSAVATAMATTAEVPAAKKVARKVAKKTVKKVAKKAPAKAVAKKTTTKKTK